LPVIRYFTVALQYRCPLALNTNVGSSFWVTPPFSRKLAQIHTICQSLDTPPCDWRNWLSSIEYLVRPVPLIEPGNHCHPTITAWLTMTAILLNHGEIAAWVPGKCLAVFQRQEIAFKTCSEWSKNKKFSGYKSQVL
jgi:hypothetical protein